MAQKTKNSKKVRMSLTLILAVLMLFATVFTQVSTFAEEGPSVTESEKEIQTTGENTESSVSPSVIEESGSEESKSPEEGVAPQSAPIVAPLTAPAANATQEGTPYKNGDALYELPAENAADYIAVTFKVAEVEGKQRGIYNWGPAGARQNSTQFTIYVRKTLKRGDFRKFVAPKDGSLIKTAEGEWPDRPILSLKEEYREDFLFIGWIPGIADFTDKNPMWNNNPNFAATHIRNVIPTDEKNSWNDSPNNPDGRNRQDPNYFKKYYLVKFQPGVGGTLVPGARAKNKVWFWVQENATQAKLDEFRPSLKPERGFLPDEPQWVKEPLSATYTKDTTHTAAFRPYFTIEWDDKAPKDIFVKITSAKGNIIIQEIKATDPRYKDGILQLVFTNEELGIEKTEDRMNVKIETGLKQGEQVITIPSKAGQVFVPDHYVRSYDGDVNLPSGVYGVKFAKQNFEKKSDGNGSIDCEKLEARAESYMMYHNMDYSLVDLIQSASDITQIQHYYVQNKPYFRIPVAVYQDAKDVKIKLTISQELKNVAIKVQDKFNSFGYPYSRARYPQGVIFVEPNFTETRTENLIELSIPEMKAGTGFVLELTGDFEDAPKYNNFPLHAVLEMTGQFVCVKPVPSETTVVVPTTPVTTSSMSPSPTELLFKPGAPITASSSGAKLPTPSLVTSTNTKPSPTQIPATGESGLPTVMGFSLMALAAALILLRTRRKF